MPESRKVTGFPSTTLHDWFKKLAPLKPTVTWSHVFFLPSCQLQVITLSFDWFIVLSVSFAIGESDKFGFGLGHSIENCFKQLSIAKTSLIKSLLLVSLELA